MEAKMMIAGSFDEFVEKITQAERKALNTPFGQAMAELAQHTWDELQAKEV